MKWLPQRCTGEYKNGAYTHTTDWREVRDRAIMPALLLTFLGLIALLVWIAIEENRLWQAFRVAHKCHVTAKISGSTFNTFDGKNVGVGSVPPKTGWTCDDGITYFREN